MSLFSIKLYDSGGPTIICLHTGISPPAIPRRIWAIVINTIYG